MTVSSSASRSFGVTMMVAIAALGAFGLSGCRRPPTAVEVDGAPAGPFTCRDWTKVASTPYPNTYQGVWGSGPTDVHFLHRNIPPPHSYLPATAELQHYDGQTVRTVKSLTWSHNEEGGIWGSSASNLYMALSGTLLRYDGTSWTKVAGVPPIVIRGIWGTGPDNVYVVGGGKVGRFDGKIWSVMLDVNDYSFNAVWGSGSNDVFVAAQARYPNSSGAVYHFDGTTWSISLSKPWYVFSGVWGTGPSDVLTVGYRGGASFIYRFDGQTWSKEALPWHETTIDRLKLVWGQSGSRVFAMGRDTLLGWDGQRWKPVAVPSGNNNILGLWGSGTSLFVAANEWSGAGAVWRATCSEKVEP
jgi:hypothetical protein